MIDPSALSGDVSSRLLPPSIPYRYFATAALFQIIMWALLLAGAGDVANFQGGPGLVLGAVHSLTLGVLTMTAVGASLQLLPVATLQPFGSLALCKAVWWLLSGGTALLAYGMASPPGVGLLPAGAALTALALALYGGQIIVNLIRARSKTGAMNLVIWHSSLALLALAALAILGVVLALNLTGSGLLDNLTDQDTVALAHLVLACYGFMGLLALGFSSILIPMFALSPAPSARTGYIVLGLMSGGIMLALVGLLAGPDELTMFGAMLGIGGGIGHVWLMEKAIKERMRRRLDGYFVLIRSGWSLLPASLAAALLWASGLLSSTVFSERLPALFGALLLVGWLLSFMLGVLHRIVPFLASMHLMTPGAAPPLLSSLTPERLQQTHIALHLAAVVLLVTGIATDEAIIIRLGAASGLAAALAFAAIIATVIKRIARTK